MDACRYVLLMNWGHPSHACTPNLRCQECMHARIHNMSIESALVYIHILTYVCSSRVLQSNSHGMFCTCSTTGVAWSIACEHYTSHLSQILLDTFRYMQQARHILRWASSLTVHRRISENNMRHEDTIWDQKWWSVCLVLLMLCSALIFLFSSAERWKFVANIIIHSNTLLSWLVCNT